MHREKERETDRQRDIKTETENLRATFILHQTLFLCVDGN